LMSRKTLGALVGIVILIFSSLLLTIACAPEGKAETTSIQIFGGRPGDHWTVLTEALTYFVNQDSEWLEASAVATGGAGEPIKIFAEEPEKRHYRIGLVRCTDDAKTYLEERDLKVQFIAACGDMPVLWVTFDPSAKTLDDLKGMRIGLPRVIPGYYDVFEQSLIDAGVRDTAEDIGGFSAQRSAIMDGLIDAALVSFNAVPGEVTPGRDIEEMMARGKVYPIDYTKERIERVAEVLGFPPLWMEVPAGSLPNQPETIYVVQFTWDWFSGPELPDEIAYEVARIAYQRASAGDFATYHAMGKAITADNVWLSIWGDNPEDIEFWYHPGALKFYREIGVL
jgi:TRAP-type uncharacterized transport system substrate-binding protein